MKSNVTTYTAIIRAAAVATAVLCCGEAFAQQYPERRHIRSGNNSYEKQDYVEAEERYRTAVAKSPVSYEAAFNLADALYKQEKYADAAEILKPLAENPALTAVQRAKVFHNLGNAMFSQQKLQEALDYYKSSLRNNPNDMETKYNLAYVKRLLDQQKNDKNQDDQNQNDQNQNGDDQKNNDQSQDKNQQDEDKKDDQSGDQNKDKGDQNDQNKNQDNNGDGEQQPEKPEPQNGDRPGAISRENAESILNAMQQQEDKTRDKVNTQKAVTVGRSGKNW